MHFSNKLSPLSASCIALAFLGALLSTSDSKSAAPSDHTTKQQANITSIEKPSRIRWKYPIDSAASAQPIVSGNVLIIQSGAGIFSDGGSTLQGLDSGTGEVQWKFKTKNHPIKEKYLLGNTLLAASREAIYFIDTITGQVVWQMEDGQTIYGAAFDDQHIYIARDKQILALDINTKEEIWSQELNARSIANESLAEKDGLLYVSYNTTLFNSAPNGEIKWKAHLVAFSSLTGKLHRKTDIPDCINPRQISVLGDNIIVYCTDEYFRYLSLHSFSYNNSALKWSYKSPKISSDVSLMEPYIYVQSSMSVVAIHSDTGKETRPSINQFGGIHPAGNIILTIAGNHRRDYWQILAQDQMTGELKWQYEIPNTEYFVIPSYTLYKDGNLYITTEEVSLNDQNNERQAFIYALE